MKTCHTLFLILKEHLVDKKGSAQKTRLRGGVDVGRKTKLKVVGVSEHFVAHSGLNLHHLANLLALLLLPGHIDVERDAEVAAAIGANIHAGTAAASGLVNVVLNILVGINHSE